MKALVLLSGGLDSATALYWAKQQGYELYILSINYHWRPPREITSVQYFTEDTGANLIEIEADFIQEAEDFKEAQISVEYFNKAPDGYIPCKNLVFYSIAIYYAEVYQLDAIIGSQIKSDALLYPDASKIFLNSLIHLANTIRLPYNPHPFKIIKPLIELSKEEVINLAIELEVPLERTWSCYDIHDVHCGKCKGCLERKRSFEKLKIKDPLEVIERPHIR